MGRLWACLGCAFALEELPESYCPDKGGGEGSQYISCLELSVTKFFLDHLSKNGLLTF